MHLALKTLLNRVEPMKGFVYESSRIHPAGKTHRGGLSATPTIEIVVDPNPWTESPDP